MVARLPWSALVAMLLFCMPATAQTRNWNAEYFSWQRGTTFTMPAGPNADSTWSGAGTGGAFAVSKVILSPAERAALLTADQIDVPPRYGKRLAWTTAPTSGEGRPPAYSAYFSTEEMWDRDVWLSAGQTVTVTACLWTDTGTRPVYLYASQFMGADRDARGQYVDTTGKYGSGNTISGTGAGVDHNTFPFEVFHRSARFTISATPKCYSRSFALDDLSGGVSGSNSAFIVGVGLDYDTLAIGSVLNMTAVHYDFGSQAVAWSPQPDETTAAAAQSEFETFGPGVSGFALSATQILLSLPLRAAMCANHPGHVVLALQTDTPTFEVGAAAKMGTGSVIVPALTLVSAKTGSAYVTISGFSGMKPGTPAIYGGPDDLIWAYCSF